MTIFFKNRSIHKKLRFDAEKKAEEVDVAHTCRYCGELVKAAEVYPTRAVYKCKNCGRESTFERGDPKKEGSKKDVKLSTITLRDKSGPAKRTPQKLAENIESNKSFADIVATVRDGMTNKKMLQFIYVDRYGNKSTKLVEPYKLSIDKTGTPILYAYCTEGDGIRAYKLTSVHNLTKQEYGFEPRYAIADETEKSSSSK